MVLFEATALALVSVQTYRAFCFQVAKILWSAKLAAQVTLSELYHCHTHSTVQTYQAFCLQVAKILWSAKLALKLLSLNLALPYSFRCTVISGLLPPSGKNCLVSQAGCQVTLSEPLHYHTHSTVQTYQAFCLPELQGLWVRIPPE